MGALLRYSLVAVFGAVGIQILPGYLAPKGTPLIGGKAEPGWEPVADVFRQIHAEGLEREGSAFAVYHKGKLVVDLWGGYADKASVRPWQRDTTAIAFSTTKSLAALAIQMLVDRGLLDYDAPVAKYWPEFAAQGKEKITVAEMMGHRAGLAVVDASTQITTDMLRHGGDFAGVAKILADMAPVWPLAKDSHGYHAVTIGILADALLRRVTNTTLTAFVRDEMAGPARADFSIGIPKADFHRVARYTHPGVGSILATMVSGGKDGLTLPWWMISGAMQGKPSLFARMMANPLWMMPTGMAALYSPETLELEMCSVGGVGTARGLAAIFAELGKGTLVKKGGAAWARALKLVPKESRTRDLLNGMTVDWNLGYWASDGKATLGKPELGHPGYGGQNVKLVPELELAYAYLTNGLVPQLGDNVPNFARLQEALMKRLKALK